MSYSFIKELKKKVLIGDGAMGTMIQSYNLAIDDYQGHDGCHEFLVLSRPDVIANIHNDFLEAGADFVETNTFGVSKIVLDEYGLASRASDISRSAAQIARQAADAYTSSDKPRFVSGSIGPTSRLPSLCQVDFDSLFESYLPGMVGLLEGGIDLFQIETCQDLLQAKCAVMAAYQAMQRVNRQVPICVTVTMDPIGTMLAGSDIATVLVVLESLKVDIIGLNCGTGPDQMTEAVRFLSQNSATPIAIVPNAGLPRNELGVAVYDLSSTDFVRQLEPFVFEYGIACVGGCCGTTPEYIRALANRFGACSAPARTVVSVPRLASSFSALPLKQLDGPLIISERCNANGSKVFRELLLKEDWEGVLALARQEVENGADVLDLCAAYVGRSEIDDLDQIVWRCNSQIKAPLMIDSTNPDVIAAALKRIAGRSIINSVNFEEGEERFDQVCCLAREHGAFLVALTIDEEGMAKTAKRKVEVAERIYKRATEQHGLAGEQLLFDPLTFTLGSGDQASRSAGIETLNAVKMIKEQLAGANTILGVSNISFGLFPAARRILNAVFLAEAVKYGLDACIIDPSKLLTLDKIKDEHVNIALDLIYARFSDEYDPLFRLMEVLQGQTSTKPATRLVDNKESTVDALKRAIIDGQKTQLPALLERVSHDFKPLEVINSILLPAMQEVGKLFAKGVMQLPFVLLSAEAMKSAVKILEPKMDRTQDKAKGRLLIATVKGDVHDIGKNLVDIIISNNGFEVIDLGIKQPIENILTAINQHKPDAIGFSGLLVKSTWVMKENLEVMSAQGIKLPVICGGAALTPGYVESELKAAYNGGPVYYGADAFSGLKIMEDLGRDNIPEQQKSKVTAKTDKNIIVEQEIGVSSEKGSCQISPSLIIPEPLFWGVRYVGSDQLSPEKIIPFINRKALFYRQWRFNTGYASLAEQQAFIKEKVEPLFEYWCQEIVKNNWLEPQLGYGYFPCQSEGNLLHIYDPQDRGQRIYTLNFPRQTLGDKLCLADYFRNIVSKEYDLIGLQLVTVGKGASERSQQLYEANEYSDYFYFHGLTVEFAEALAEYWHQQIRLELGIADSDGAEPKALFAKKYQGARYSFGYAACPNIEDQKLFFKLFDPAKLGISLTSEYQLVPEQSTSAIIVHHPEAKYFAAN